MIDMHVHTNASDGDHSPEEVIKMAKDVGITHMAITDHDTIDGLNNAKIQADKLNIKLLNGVEMASNEYKNMHILCLGFKYPNDELQEVLTKWKNSRHERTYCISKYLKDIHNIDISVDEVFKLAENSVISRMHFAQILLNRGYVKTISESFEKYLDTPEFHKTDRKKPSTERVFEIINKSGGMGVLAHPSSLNISDEDFDTLICKMKNLGLKGLECYYCKHDKSMTEKYIAVAKKYDLLITGGSDFHGENAKPNLKLGTGYNNTFYYNDIDTFNIFYNNQNR